eukprot:g23994.t2
MVQTRQEMIEEKSTERGQGSLSSSIFPDHHHTEDGQARFRPLPQFKTSLEESLREVRRSWKLQRHLASAFLRLWLESWPQAAKLQLLELGLRCCHREPNMTELDACPAEAEAVDDETTAVVQQAKAWHGKPSAAATRTSLELTSTME